MTPLSDERPGDEVLIDYLLGTLSENETERLDELSVADDEVGWRLQAIENDLVDAYVAGQLSGVRLEQFRSYYLSSAVRRQRTEFARTLQSHGIRGAAASAGTARDLSHSDDVAIPTSRPPVHRRILPQWALAAAALVAAVGVGYFALDNRRLREQVRQAEAARANGEQTVQTLRTELGQQRSANAAAQAELERVRPPVPSPRSAIQALILLPLRRGTGEVPTVLVPRGTGQLPLRLRLEGDSFPRYEAVLRDSATGQSVWRSGPLDARSGGTYSAVVVDVPVALLRSANYTLEVTGLRRNDAAEFVSSYAFRVVVE